VRELLAAGTRDVREVWIADSQDPSPQLDEIERLAQRRRARVLLVPRGRLASRARTEVPQGVVAFARALQELDVDELVEDGGGPPFLLVLDGVTDPHNVGALLRSAECAGVTGVVLARHRAAHMTPTVTKVAAGAIEHLRFAVVPGIPTALRRLEELGVTSVGLDAEQRRSVYDLPAAAAGGAVALVVGAEGQGLSALVRRRCTMLAGIPQHGRVPSLNVATAGAVACFELARRRSAAGPSMTPAMGSAPQPSGKAGSTVAAAGPRAEKEPVVGLEPTT
jgi:23S rRNA (guanosine2251-2'-O)-methyltransferase